MNRMQLLTWAVVLLVITNIATVGTILYHNYKESMAADDIAIGTGTGINMLNGRYFRQELGFNDVQMKSFRESNQAFRPYAMGIIDGVDSLKTEMFNELLKTAPDTVKLNELSDQIGNMHGKLKYETYHFYLSIKKVCDPAQGLALGKAFQPLFKSENITTPNQYRRRGWKRN